jgi:hypothetical protein
LKLRNYLVYKLTKWSYNIYPKWVYNVAKAWFMHVLVRYVFF